jgi:microcystin-dependent protein
MAAIFSNLKGGTITDNPLTNVATTINSTAFVNLPTVTAPDFMWLVLDPDGSGNGPEIVKVTAHTASATSVTVTRAQQSTTGVQHAVGTEWVAAFTKDDADQLPFRLMTTTGDLLYASAANTAARLAIGTAGHPLVVSGGGLPTYAQLGTAGIADDAVTLSKLADEIVNRLVPAGTIRTTLAATADPGWLLDNQTVVGAQSSYPALWAVAPASWKSGSDLVIPNLADIVLSGAGTTTLGAVGGLVGNTVTLATANLPAHDHTIDHDHGSSSTGTESATHYHSADGSLATSTISATGFEIVRRYASYGTADYVALLDADSDGQVSNGGATFGSGMALDVGGEPTHNHDVTGNTATESATHTHSFDVPAFVGLSGLTGSGTAVDVRNRHLAVKYQIKAH